MKKINNIEKKIMPPLSIWLIFSVIALIALVTLIKLRSVKNENDFIQRTSYLEDKIKTAEHGPLIIILGTSLTRCAFDSSSKMENFIRNNTGKKIAIAKIWRDGTNLETIIKSMPGLKKIHPDLLIVEANMFCYSAEQKLIDNIPSLLYNITTQKIYNPYLAEKKPQKPQDYGQIKTRTGVVDTSQLRLFKQLASQLERQGTRVILVNIPLEASEEIRKWNSSDTVYFKRNFNYIQKEVLFTYLDPKLYWDMSYYYNRGHLNMKGCNAFTKWFCKQLSKEVKQL